METAAPTKSLIVATDRRGVIGRDGQLPWRLASDLRRFKQLTMHHCMIMGRKTFESIGRALPGRTSIVLSRKKPQLPEGVLHAHSLEEAWRLCGEDDQPFVIGGGEIYALALPEIDCIHRTLVDAEVDGDVRFPELDPQQWVVTEHQHIAAGDRDQYPTRYEVLRRAGVGGQQETR